MALEISLSWFDLDKKIDLLIDNSHLWVPLRFLITSGSYICYTTHDPSYKSFTITKSYGSFRPFIIKIDRGKILDEFSKLEFLTSQIIFASLVPYKDVDFWDAQQISRRNDILDAVSFDQKISYIKEKLTDKDSKKKLDDCIYKLKKVRNALAHSMNDRYVEYKEMPLSKNLTIFCDDMEITWNLFLDIYAELRSQEWLVDHLLVCIEKKKSK